MAGNNPVGPIGAGNNSPIGAAGNNPVAMAFVHRKRTIRDQLDGDLVIVQKRLCEAALELPIQRGVIRFTGRLIHHDVSFKPLMVTSSRCCVRV
jgi:hypothetical protein